MVDSANNEDTPGQGKTRRPKMGLQQKGIVIILWALIGIAPVIYWYASPMIALFAVYGTYRLAGYCRKRYQAHMLPPSFIARCRGSQLYQIYVVRAVRRRGSHLLLLIALIAFAFTVGNWVDSLNPVLKLEEMESRTGTVIKVVKRRQVGTRKTCGDFVYLETGDGTIIRYNGWLNSDALRNLYGRTTKDVTIWSRRRIQLPPCADTNWITQVKIGNHIVDRYDNINRRKNIRKWLLRLNFIYPAIGLLALLGILIADRRRKDER